MKSRRRCCECRRWYVPSCTAAHTQKTCCPACRARRLRKLARRRRALDVEEYRADERERQRECRARRRAESDKGTKEPLLSHAGLLPREAILCREIIESWDKQMMLSRAYLERRISVLLGRAAKKPGQAGTENGDCHAPA